MATFSFLDVVASITGPGGAFPLGTGAGPSEEGISIEMAEDKDNMVIGADGQGMHNLHAGQSGTITVRLLKTSPANALLSAMYNLQTVSSVVHGQNTIVVTNIATGDTTVGIQAAFRRQPNNAYAKDAAVIEWVWNCIRITQQLGVGVQ